MCVVTRIYIRFICVWGENMMDADWEKGNGHVFCVFPTDTRVHIAMHTTCTDVILHYLFPMQHKQGLCLSQEVNLVRLWYITFCLVLIFYSKCHIIFYLLYMVIFISQLRQSLRGEKAVIFNFFLFPLFYKLLDLKKKCRLWKKKDRRESKKPSFIENSFQES